MFQLSRTLHSHTLAIAICHRLCFQNSFSSKLGEAYCKKTMEWFLAGDNRFLFHVVNDKNEVVGYCGGFCPQFNGDGSTSGMMQFAMHEAVKGVLLKPWLLFNKEVISAYPLILKNIRRKFFLTKKKQATPILKQNNDEKKVGLVVIGIHPDYRGKGVFELLMINFEAEAQQRNISKLILSVKKNNTRAVNAYSKMGWHVFADKGLSLEMTKEKILS